AVSRSLITIIANICRSFRVTCSSASPPETKAGTRWCCRKLLRSSAGVVCSDTRNVKAAPRLALSQLWGAQAASLLVSAGSRNERFFRRCALHWQWPIYRIAALVKAGRRRNSCSSSSLSVLMPCVKPIRLSDHALRYMSKRGFTVAEVEETIRTAPWQPAELGRLDCRKNFSYGTEWN